MGGQGRVDGRQLGGEQGAKGVLGTLALSVISGPLDLWTRRQKQKESKKNRNSKRTCSRAGVNS